MAERQLENSHSRWRVRFVSGLRIVAFSTSTPADEFTTVASHVLVASLGSGAGRGRPEARAAAVKALELRTLPDAHVSLAECSSSTIGTGAAAEKEFRRSLELNPNLLKLIWDSPAIWRPRGDSTSPSSTFGRPMHWTRYPLALDSMELMISTSVARYQVTLDELPERSGVAARLSGALLMRKLVLRRGPADARRRRMLPRWR